MVRFFIDCQMFRRADFPDIGLSLLLKHDGSGGWIYAVTRLGAVDGYIAWRTVNLYRSTDNPDTATAIAEASALIHLDGQLMEALNDVRETTRFILEAITKQHE